MEHKQHATDDTKTSSNPRQSSPELHEGHKRSRDHHNAERGRGGVEQAPSAAPHTKNNVVGSHNQTKTYRETIEQVQKELPRSTRGFSRFIHIPAVEKISDIIADTIARPDALLFGGISAFVLVLAVYSYAKYAGFALQGSETIIAFGLGWSLGIIVDIIRRIFTRNRD